MVGLISYAMVGFMWLVFQMTVSHFVHDDVWIDSVQSLSLSILSSKTPGLCRQL